MLLLHHVDLHLKNFKIQLVFLNTDIIIKVMISKVDNFKTTRQTELLF